MLDKGPQEFFGSTWSDYVPLPIYGMATVVWLSEKITIEFSLLFKVLIVMLELFLLFALYHKMPAPKSKWLVVALLFLSPALIGDGALWGQLDSVPTLLTLLAFLYVDRRYIPGILFGIALAIKPIFILLAPLLAFLAFPHKTMIHNAVVSFLIIVASGLPVVPSLEVVTFLREKIFEQASTYPFRTINAFNFWNLGNPLNLWPPDNVSYLGMSAHAFGLCIFFVLSFLTLLSWRRHNFDRKFAFRVAATILIVFYTFTTRMHERHLLFGLPFLALAALQERSIIIPFIFLSASFCLNLWSAYYWVLYDQTWPITQAIAQATSWVVVASTLSLLVWDWKSLFLWLVQKIKANYVLVTILIFAACLRLINLAYPQAYIFDEVYHAFTARELLHNHQEAWEWWTTPPPGVAYEWTHPPLAKYGMGIGMLIFGENAFGWRFVSALMGVLSVLGVYKLTNLLFKQRRLSLVAALLVTIEGLNIAQSRIAMNDIYMLTFLLWSFVAALGHKWKVAAVIYGLALASKWSALYGLLPLATVFIHQHLPFISSYRLSSIIYHLTFSLRLVSIALLVYLTSFIPFLVAGHTPDQLLELHNQMWYYHTHLVATHDYQSVPWTWVLSIRPVWYFVEYGERVANIYVQGNPLILWLGLASLAISLVKIKQFPHLFLLVSYLSLVLPWVFSPRIMFFYHYLPSATFLTINLAAWLVTVEKKYQWGILAACFVSLLVVAPLLFGIPMTPTYTDTIFKLLPSWK